MANAWPGSQRHGQRAGRPAPTFWLLPSHWAPPDDTDTAPPGPATLPAGAAFCRLSACGKVPLTSSARPGWDQHAHPANTSNTSNTSSRVYSSTRLVTCLLPTAFLHPSTQPHHPKPCFAPCGIHHNKRSWKRKKKKKKNPSGKRHPTPDHAPDHSPLTASLQPSAHSTRPAPRPQTHSALAAASASPPAPAARAHACSSPTCSQSAAIILYDKEKKNSLFLRHSVRLAHHAHVLRIRARPPAGVRLGGIVLSVRRQMACLCVARRRRIRHAWGRRAHV
jgi:hypothetical protein